MTGARPPRWVAEGNDYRGILHREPGPPPSFAVLTSGDMDRIHEATADYEGEVVVIDQTVEDLVSATDGFDVIAVVGEQVPEPGWIEAHARWHRRASNVVVLGVNDDPASNAIVRGSRQLLGNDEAFVAITRHNVSLPRSSWLENRNLDIVSGWRLWGDGHFLTYEPEAVLTGQRRDQHTVVPNALALADAIPHRRFRVHPSAFHTTPKISWVVGVADTDLALEAWATCHRSTYSDHEVVFHGPAGALAQLQSVAAQNPRVTVVEGDEGTFPDAVSATRGELLAIFDPRVSLPPEIVAKAVSRFEANPSAPVIRVGYDMAGGRYLRLDDLAALDAHIGREGLPLFSLVTRRELTKDLGSFDDPARGWSDTLARCEQSLVVSPLGRMPGDAPFEPDRPGLGELRSMGVMQAAREVVRAARRRRQDEERTAESPSGTEDDRISVAYVGFTGHDNLGDEAVRVAIERLMPWARFETDPANPRLLMVGGGTLINGRRYYLNRMLRQEAASVERALFGTGVRSPEYWGVTEPMEDWFSFIDSSLFAAVRGPDSVRNLRTLGYGKDLPIIGDPALFLEAPEDVTPVDGRVVVCPVYTSGNLHGGDDEVVFDALARLIEKMNSEGREVVMLSAFPQDDRWVIDIMRRAKSPDLPYVAGYADIDDTMRLLASADLVVGERLHAAIMAAAAGTPFVGLEYRPKLRDFGRSVNQEDAIIRTDEMERLEAVCSAILARREDVIADIEAKVSEYRRKQTDAAEELRRRLLAS